MLKGVNVCKNNCKSRALISFCQQNAKDLNFDKESHSAKSLKRVGLLELLIFIIYMCFLLNITKGYQS